MFCDVPRSNLHFLRNGGFHRNDTFRHISYINPGTNLVINVTFASVFFLSHEAPGFCDVPRSNLHFWRNGGFHRNDTFKHISYINPGTNLVITVTFASAFFIP